MASCPAGLKVKRRARALHARLQASETRNLRQSIPAMDYASMYAIAVNEENAAGGRVVTAPTNGAAGRHSGRAALLRRPLPGCVKGRRQDFSPDQRGDRRAVQDECVDLGCGSRMPGRGRCGMLHGSSRLDRGPGRQRPADRECRGDWDGASSRDDLRPDRRAGANPVHRTQCIRRHQGRSMPRRWR